ncbi:hypothetical protein Gpo141_00012658 [Globisporangium polare]
MASQHAHGHGNGGECCADHDHDADLEMMSDPTMASCCERDQRDYDKAMELKRVLTLHDPTSGGVRLRQQLFEPTAHDFAIAHKQQQLRTQSQPTFAALESEKDKRREEDHDEDDGSDFDDSDFELDDSDPIFEARRKELEAQIQVAMQNAADGYGVVTETDFARLLQELRATPELPRAVLVTNSQVDSLRARETVREMGNVAKKYVGTKFHLVTVRGNGEDGGLGAVSARDLRLKSVPCVVAFRNGEQVDSAVLDDKSSVDAATLWEARLVPWLSMCNVLTTKRQERNAGATGGGGHASRKQNKEQADEPPVYDCGVENCRIRFGFEHEHVGPSQEAKGEISAWRS